MSSLSKSAKFIGPVVVVALGTVTLATAQSASPFAKKKRTQAWESVAPASPSAPAPQPTYAPQATPSSVPPSYAPRYSAPSSAPSSVSGDFSSNYRVPPAPSVPATQPGAYYPGRTQAAARVQSQDWDSAPDRLPTRAPSYAPPAQSQSQPQSQSSFPQQYGQSSTPPSYPPSQYPPSQYPPSQYPPSSAPPAQYPQTQAPRGSWKDRLGLGRIQTLFTGGLRVGAAMTNRKSPDPLIADETQSDWGEDFIADADLEFEASTITQGGLEYGINLGARAQYDKYRRGFGGRVPDCPPTEIGCSSALVGTVPTGLRGHTSQFYATGENDAKDTQIALESAHLFLRSAYGDVTVGRDDGAAYLFSLGAPSLLAVGASNSPVDYTGLDSVKTVNDASGFSEKITYTTPRLLGDTVGVGVQLGASYAPNARACGVDYCVRRSDAVAGVISPDLKDVMEIGLALDRTFDNGLSVEATATYARANETSGLAGLDDLSAINAGLEVKLSDWTVGGSYLTSNNGLADGDYEAYDFGLTWKPSALGFTLGYGHASDDNVGLKSDQWVAGVSYDFNKFTLGTGLQYVDRSTTGLTGTLIGPNEEKATALFVEGGFKF